MFLVLILFLLFIYLFFSVFVLFLVYVHDNASCFSDKCVIVASTVLSRYTGDRRDRQTASYDNNRTLKG